MTSLTRNGKQKLQNLRHSLARSNSSISFFRYRPTQKVLIQIPAHTNSFIVVCNGDFMAPESLPYSLTRNYRTCRLQVGKLTQGRNSEGRPAGAFSGPRPGPRDVPACDVIMMAGAGGAAGPAPDVRHQPPGKSNYYTHNFHTIAFTLVAQWLCQPASMLKVMGSNPTLELFLLLDIHVHKIVILYMPCIFQVYRYIGCL